MYVGSVWRGVGLIPFRSEYAQWTDSEDSEWETERVNSTTRAQSSPASPYSGSGPRGPPAALSFHSLYFIVWTLNRRKPIRQTTRLTSPSLHRIPYSGVLAETECERAPEVGGGIDTEKWPGQRTNRNSSHELSFNDNSKATQPRCPGDFWHGNRRKEVFLREEGGGGQYSPRLSPKLVEWHFIIFYFILFFFFGLPYTERKFLWSTSPSRADFFNTLTSSALHHSLAKGGERERERKKRGTSSIRPIKFYGTFERCIGLCPPGSWSWLSYLSPLSLHYFRPNLIPLRAFPAPHLPYLFTSVWMEHIL